MPGLAVLARIPVHALVGGLEEVSGDARKIDLRRVDPLDVDGLGPGDIRCEPVRLLDCDLLGSPEQSRLSSNDRVTVPLEHLPAIWMAVAVEQSELERPQEEVGADKANNFLHSLQRAI